VSSLRRAGLVATLLLASGCAQRGVVSGPPSDTGAGTWWAVGVAIAAAILVLAALIVLPAWRAGGSVLAAGVLGLQAAAAAVGAAILLGAAYQGAHVLTRPPDSEPAVSLLSISGLDGSKRGFFVLMAGMVLVLGGLLVTVLALAARFAADRDPLERFLACGTLALEALLSVTAIVVWVLGYQHLPVLLMAAALPVFVVGSVACWPRQQAAQPELGYNDGHG